MKPSPVGKTDFFSFCFLHQHRLETDGVFGKVGKNIRLKKEKYYKRTLESTIAEQRGAGGKAGGLWAICYDPGKVLGSDLAVFEGEAVRTPVSRLGMTPD